MSDWAYFIRLGQTLYLDSYGVVHQGQPPPSPKGPTYLISAGAAKTLTEVAKLSKTFKDIGDALPSAGDAEKFSDFAKQMAELHVPDDVVKLLGVIGKIAGAIGTAFVVVGVAVAAAKMLGLFGDAPDEMKTLVNARFDAVDRALTAMAKLIEKNDLRTQSNSLNAAVLSVRDYISARDAGTQSPAQLQARLQNMVSLLQVVSTTAALNLTDSSTYVAFFNPVEYQNVWPWVSRNLYTTPEGSAPVRALMPPVNTPVFDSRLALPLAMQAAQSYLAMVQSLNPEFRTTGEFRPQIMELAKYLQKLAESIKNTTLARTIYSAADFSGITDHFVDDPWPGVIPPTLKPEYFLPVGALDLSNHTNEFFGGVGPGANVPFPGPSKQGNMDFRWKPPAVLVANGVDVGLFHWENGRPVKKYAFVNAKECADAANDQSLQDYSDLLVTSGYLTIVQLTALLRHAATQPAVSETVRGGVMASRWPLPGAQVTLHSRPNTALYPRQPDRDISALAWREPQKITAVANCTTQSLKRQTLINYRIFLRTISSAVPPRAWHGANYESVQLVAYMDDPDPVNPGFKRLQLQNFPGSVLQEKLMFQGTSSDENRMIEDTLQFSAHTFDWWIPTKSKSLATVDDSVSRFLLSAGVTPTKVPKFVQPTRSTLRTTSAASDLVDDEPLAPAFLGKENGAQDWTGFHREMELTTVEFHVKARWKSSSLEVVINNRPQDRNYIVFLVVEETFGSIAPDERPPKVLHTAFPIPINGQLTYVPQSLFDEENAIRVKRVQHAAELGAFAQPTPGEKIFGVIDPGELATDAGIERFAAEIQRSDPELQERFARLAPRVSKVPVQADGFEETNSG